MRAGEIQERITFQTPVEVNTNGSLVISYATASPPDLVFAKVIEPRGGEAFEAARVNARKTIRVGIRYRADVLSTWRFLWEGQPYNIKLVDQSGRISGETWLTGECVNAP